jgi:hypothetical protein
MHLHRSFLQGGLLSIMSLLPVGGVYVAEADGDTQDFERGMELANKARDEVDWQRRDELFAEAQAAFSIFVEENATHKSAHSALHQLGGVLVERAALHQKLYDSTGEENHRVQARAMHSEAYQVHYLLKMGLQRELKQMAVYQSSGDDATARRDQLRGLYVQSALFMALGLEHEADAYDQYSVDQKRILAKAAEEYGQIYKDHRTLLAGLYARLGQGRCLRKQGKCQRALELMQELLGHPDTVIHLRKFKTKAFNVLLDCLTDDSQTDYRQAIQLGDEWLAKHGEEDPESADWLEFRYRLAQAHRLFADTVDSPALGKTHLDRARTLAEYVARHEGDFRTQARELMAGARREYD